MSPRPADQPRVRAFVALDLPDPVRAGLAAWADAELTDPALRRTRPEQLHVTLCFLGSVPEPAVADIAAILTGLEPRPVPMRFEPEPVARPSRRPRLFALDLDSPATSELQAELQERLAADGHYEPEKRPFWPHVTVARVRTEGRRQLRVARRPGELPRALVHTFGSVRASLYRSNLRPDGARYVSLANLDLPPAEPGGER